LDVIHTFFDIYSRSGDVLDFDFHDAQWQQPLGAARLSDFATVSGLTVRGHPAPDAYYLQLRSRCGRVHAEIEYTALMRPVNLKETAVGPVRAGFAAFHRAGRGDVPIGHTDQTMHAIGQLRIDDDHFDVDCITNRDHSWSPR